MTSQSFTLSFSPSLKTLINSNSSGDCLPYFSVSFSKKIPCSSFGFCLKRKILGFDEKINGFGGNFGIFSAWREEGQLEELDDAPLTVELQQICSESQFDRVIAEAQQLEESLIILWMASWCRKCIYLKPKLEKLAADFHPRSAKFHFKSANTINLIYRNEPSVASLFLKSFCFALLPSCGTSGHEPILFLLSPYHVDFVSCLKLFMYEIEQASLVIKDINLLSNGSCRLRFYCVDVNTVPHNLVARAGVTLWRDSKKQAEVIGGHKAYLVVNEVRQMIENECTA
ncbi:hypothetical protein Godav_009800 [Gossypium davidsonii]|uniref:Thioredoxin domain-containing protein n=1 Tax=Gossypium davidsonii TaxID=34287 RepID=A0A7J8SG11_GOSDV|nr:hypothetical protein [Gossypium davidsonii]